MADNDFAYGFTLGSIHSYLAMMKAGLKDVCTPAILISSDSEHWDEIYRIIEEEGFKSLRFDFSSLRKLPYYTKQLIIYAPGKWEKANKLWRLLLVEHKTAEHHRLIGRLFGYPEEKIEAWLKEQKEDEKCTLQHYLRR